MVKNTTTALLLKTGSAGDSVPTEVLSPHTLYTSSDSALF